MMTLAFKLTLPVLIGGAVALIASGVFTPYVHAAGLPSDTIAHISPISPAKSLVLRHDPSDTAAKSGSLPLRSWVWVERCVENDNAQDWCLVERSGVRGWVDAGNLTPHWD